MPFVPLVPRVRSTADLRKIEETSLDKAIPCGSTYAMLRDSAAAFGDKPALTMLVTGDPEDEPLRWSYAELFANVTRAANAFHALGVGREDAVAFLLPGCREAHLALWGGGAAGIAQPLNPLLTVEKLADLLRAGNAKVLIAWGDEAEAGYWSKAKRLMGMVDGLKHLTRVDPGHALGGEAAPSDEAPSLHDLIAAQPADRLMFSPEPGPDDVAAYFHTGGTTGAPKLAKHSHRGQLFAAWACVQLQGMGSSDIIINGYPLFHVAGVIPASLTAFSAGVEVVVPTTLLLRNKDVLRNYWKLAARYRATALSCVPTVLATLADTPLDGADISSITYCRTGAAPLPPELAERFERQFGLHVHESLGMTESHGIMSIRPPGVRAPAGCVGFPLPHARIRIMRIDAEGNPTRVEADVNEPGMILYKAPNVFPGYVDEKATAKAIDKDGWLVTGDIGRVDGQGLVHMAGRAKDLIIRSGHNIDPKVIEDALDAHPSVRYSAAVGAPDSYAGELPVAFAVLAPGAQATETELLDFVRGRVDEPPARPKWVRIIETMPVTNVGKIFKPELRRMAMERVAQDALAALAAERGVEAPALHVEETEGGLVVKVGGDEGLRDALAAALDALPGRPKVLAHA